MPTSERRISIVSDLQQERACLHGLVNRLRFGYLNCILSTSVASMGDESHVLFFVTHTSRPFQPRLVPKSSVLVDKTRQTIQTKLNDVFFLFD